MSASSVSYKHFAFFTTFSFAALALLGCYAGNANPVPAGGGYHWTVGPGAAEGVPCAVAAVLRQNCYGCHAGAFAPRLVSYADLQAPSTRVPSQTVLERAIDLMGAGTPQMPPGGGARVSTTDIEVLQAWVAGGTLMETCTEDGGVIPPNPYDTPTVCTSGTTWRYGEFESWDMIPGGDCIACHQRRFEGPLFDVAGTVYPSAHEPLNCNGASGAGPDGAVVIVTGANGAEYRTPTNRVGNFGAWTPGLVLPYTARVEYQGRRRDMVSAQTSGDCNVCHTLAGTTITPGGIAAPGRIMLP